MVNDNHIVVLQESRLNSLYYGKILILISEIKREILNDNEYLRRKKERFR